MKSSLALLILLLASQSADAKCAADFRVFSGVVTDNEGKPVAGAMVGISWSEKDGPAGPAMTVSDSDGRYRIPVLFETYSGKGRVVEDECTYRVEVISFSASTASLRSSYAEVHIGDAEHVPLPTAVIRLDAPDPTLLKLLRRPTR